MEAKAFIDIINSHRRALRQTRARSSSWTVACACGRARKTAVGSVRGHQLRQG
ncbi:hypothetical protein HMPREF0185_01444 [Brevundimonas diminuta 470-4]|nr:hypothetical protein HMPREF0185_01444 [Brevundimonas diminuta 470-4]